MDTAILLAPADEMTLGEGLRALSAVVDALQDLKDENAIYMLVSYPGLYITANGDTADEKKANAARAARIVKDVTGRTIDKKYSNGNVELSAEIVKYDLRVLISAGNVCTRKVVGTETVEIEKVVSKTVETVTEEREIVEWDCNGGLNINGADDAEA